MKKNRQMYMQKVADRAAILKAADDALKDGNQDLYNTKMAEAVAMNPEITALRDLINESERFEDGLPQASHTPAVQDIDQMADKLRNGGKITLNQGEVLCAMREAVNEAILTSTHSLTAPVRTGEEIHDTKDSVSGVLDLVRVENLEGCTEWQEPYVKTVSTASKGTDGIAPTESDPVFRVAAVKPTLVNTLSYVSRHIGSLTNAAYLEKVKSLALQALRRKLVEHITKGDGATFFGFLNAKNTKNEVIYGEMVVDTATIDEKLLRNIVLGSGGDDTIGAGWLALNKKDLIAFGDVRGADKKPVYEITPDSATHGNTGTIKDGGLTVPYVIDSQLTALSDAVKTSKPIQTMAYGAMGAYLLGLFGDYTVEVDTSYKFAENLWTVRGEVQAGGNLTAHEAVTVITLGATG